MWETPDRIYSFPVTAHGEFRCRNDRFADWPRGMADPAGVRRAATLRPDGFASATPVLRP